MEQEFTPEKSLELITQVIRQAKSKFEEDGVIYMMWGILLFGTSTTQYFLLQNGYFKSHFYPYFILPLGMVVSILYYRNKQKRKGNQISSMISVTWGVVGFNLMFMGFFFWNALQSNMVPVMLILMGIGTFVSGKAINSRLIMGAGLLLNITGFVGFQFALASHPLLLGISSLLFIFVPGLIIWIKKKKNV